MSNGLNNLLRMNVGNFLNNHALETALLGYYLYLPPLGISNYDLMRSGNWPADQGTILIGMPAGGGLGDPAVVAWWLPQRGYVDVPRVGPPANFIFTPELSGCKIRVDRGIGAAINTYRVFHIQHEAVDYPRGLRGNCRITIDSTYDYAGAPRCAALLHFGAGGWSIWIQELTGVVGVGGGALVYPGGIPAINGVHQHFVP